MNSIGSAHANLVPASLKILLVSTPDRILFIIGSYFWPSHQSQAPPRVGDFSFSER